MPLTITERPEPSSMGDDGHARGPTGSGPTTIHSRGQGISVRLPPGWPGRIINSHFDYPDAAVVYLANFLLPPNDEPVIKSERAIGPSNVLIIVTESPKT